MTTWAEAKASLRRTVLSDELVAGDTPRWSDDIIFDAWKWGQRQLAPHTADIKTIQIVDGADKVDGDPAQGQWDLSTETEFDLPDNLFERLDISGSVYAVNAVGEKQQYNPLFYTRGRSPYAKNDSMFWTAPRTKLHLSSPPGAGNTLIIVYFSIWDEPASKDDDTFEVTIPTWAYPVVMMFTGAHCLTNLGLKASNIRQWNTRDDSGRPVDNPIVQAEQWLTKRALDMLDRITRQDRANFFRTK